MNDIVPPLRAMVACWAALAPLMEAVPSEKVNTVESFCLNVLDTLTGFSEEILTFAPAFVSNSATGEIVADDKSRAPVPETVSPFNPVILPEKAV